MTSEQAAQVIEMLRTIRTGVCFIYLFVVLTFIGLNLGWFQIKLVR